MGEKWPVPMSLPCFAVEAYVPEGESRIRPKKKINKESLPAGTGTKIYFSSLFSWEKFPEQQLEPKWTSDATSVRR